MSHFFSTPLTVVIQFLKRQDISREVPQKQIQAMCHKSLLYWGRFSMRSYLASVWKFFTEIVLIYSIRLNTQVVLHWHISHGRQLAFSIRAVALKKRWGYTASSCWQCSTKTTEKKTNGNKLTAYWRTPISDAWPGCAAGGMHNAREHWKKCTFQNSDNQSFTLHHHWF